MLTDYNQQLLRDMLVSKIGFEEDVKVNGCKKRKLYQPVKNENPAREGETEFFLLFNLFLFLVSQLLLMFQFHFFTQSPFPVFFGWLIMIRKRGVEKGMLKFI